MIIHENRLLADDSHVILYLIFVENLGKMSQNLSSAAVMIGALRIIPCNLTQTLSKWKKIIRKLHVFEF